MVKFLRIGKETDNDMRYDDPHISRHHAVIYRAGEGFHIYDLASTNHIYVDGHPVAHSEVQRNSRVTLGRTHELDLDEIERRFTEAEREEIALAQRDVDFLRIGNAPANELRIDHSHVSHYHAIICRSGKEFHIYDAGSLNKVYVNSRPIEHAPIRETDRVTVGQLIELPWNRVIELFEQRRTQPESAAASKYTSGKTTWIRKQLSALRAEQTKELKAVQQEQRKRIRYIAIAGGGAVLLILGLIFKMYITEENFPKVIEQNRNAIVMIVHEYTHEIKNGDEPQITYTEIGGVRMRVFSQPSAEGVNYGSGFLYEHNGSLRVITNKHVAQPIPGKTKRLAVKFQGELKEYEAEVLQVHPAQDLAILGLKEHPANWQSVDLDADWQKVKDGDRVACMSFPLGMQGQVGPQIKADLIQGNISNKFSDHIKYTLASAPGASGGPVFNVDGKVIAINRGGSIDEEGRHYQGLNWGIPVRFAIEMLQ